MILFRLLGFFLRVVASFFFVFLLQIQFAGKSLESYLSDFGKRFIVTRTLQKVGEDGVKVLKNAVSSKDRKEHLRKISSTSAGKHIKDLAKKIEFPQDFSKEEETKSSP